MFVSFDKWLPIFVHLPSLWQPIAINSIRHISKIFVIKIVSLISNLYVVILNK